MSVMTEPEAEYVTQSASGAVAMLSCKRCNQRKQGCDRQLPSCSRCLKAGARCDRLSNECSMMLATNGSIQKKGPVALLRDRLTTLQALVDAQSGVDPKEKDTSANTSTHSSSTRRAIARENLCHGASELSFGRLALAAMSEPTRKADQVFPDLSIPRIICDLTEVYGGNPELTQRTGPMWDGIASNIRQTGLMAEDRFVVPRTEALRYLKSYFDVVDFRYPRLSQDEASAGVDVISAQDHQQYIEAVDSNPARVFMAYMIMAIVPLISESYPGAQSSFIAVHMLSQALKILDKVFRLEDSIDIIQCLRLLVIFSLHSSAAGSSWHLISFAMKKCVALGFHRELYKIGSGPQNDHMEQRRWAFWSCYLLDRLICTALNRPYSISDLYITVKFPGEDSNANRPVTPAEARQIHLYRYAVLQSEVFEDRGHRIFQYHLSHLLHWRANGPDHLEPYPIQQYQLTTSLYHTLLLRIIIDQIIYPQRLCPNEGEALSLPWTPASDASSTPRYRRISKQPQDHLMNDQMKLLPTCQAVVQSLNRADMKDRSVLSWVTGYSAVSAAFGLLYWMSKQQTCGPQASTTAESRAVDLTSGSTDLELGAELLEGALFVISKVSRHFSRIGDYRQVILNLQSLFTNERWVDDVEKKNETIVMIRDLGLDHLRMLAEGCLRSTA